MKAYGRIKGNASCWTAFGYALLIAAGCLLICSKSSPLYPINDWSDANIYFTMGKGMANGRVLYRDIYDHKGPLLYGLHALCYWISPTSFLGVWMMEVISAAFFLYGTWKLLALYGAKKSIYCALPALAMAVFSSVSFQQGDSAEEFCIPLMTWSLYEWLRFVKTGENESLSIRQLLLHGALCGCVLWIKFTMLGFYAAWIGLAVGSLALRQQWAQAWKTLAWFFGGILLATVPWILYFGWNGAMLSWLKCYLYDNLFLYSGMAESSGLIGRIKDIVKSALDWFGKNLFYTLLLGTGLIWPCVNRQAKTIERLSVWLLFGMAAFGVFIGGKSYLYYGLILAAFAGLGLIPVCRLLERRVQGMLSRRWPAMLACLLAFAGCFALSPNTRTSFLEPQKNTMQYRIAAVINQTPAATLLNYGFMDAGFYTATGITPNIRYFHQNNVPLQEMLDEQERYLREGTCDYVITRGKQPDWIEENYDLIAVEKAPDDFWYSHVYLYRKKVS